MLVNERQPSRRRHLGASLLRITDHFQLLSGSSHAIILKPGPVAQWLAQTTHNRLVAGSTPAGPTYISMSRVGRRSIKEDGIPFGHDVHLSPGLTL
jgi:hypothetical protein